MVVTNELGGDVVFVPDGVVLGSLPAGPFSGQLAGQIGLADRCPSRNDDVFRARVVERAGAVLV
jgi:hypothetical protein